MNSSNVICKEKSELKSKEIFKSLKSDYFLKKLFDFLTKRKFLNIIKYNGNIKNRINVNINNYIEYLEIYSPIEIDIKPANNKYGTFINIKKEEEMYYHIYFNDNKEEIKRNYLKDDEQIRTIKIIIDHQVESFEGLFKYCECIEYIYFKKFYRNNINNMASLFSDCLSLKNLDMSNFNTNNVKDMSSMFYGCSSLKELNVSNFNTNNVINMLNMFSHCSSLKELDISNFNTNNVTNMKYMFCGCSSLKGLDLSDFSANNVTDMEFMFDRCSKELQMKIKSRYKNIKKEAFYSFLEYLMGFYEN